MRDMKVFGCGERTVMPKPCAMLVAGVGMLLVARSAWAGEIEVLYEGQWKALKTELHNGREYVALPEIAKVAGGEVLRDGLRVKGVTFRLVEDEAGVVVGETTFLLSAPPVKQRGTFWVPVEFVVRALEVRFGEGRVYWNKSARVVWIGKERYNLRLLRNQAYPDYTRIVVEPPGPPPPGRRPARRPRPPRPPRLKRSGPFPSIRATGDGIRERWDRMASTRRM